MKAEQRRLLRLQRLERVRAIARQTAAAEAARAESTLSKLEMLAERTRLLVGDYTARKGARDGAALRNVNEFADGLQTIAARTSGDADAARRLADSKMADLAAAERRRAAVDERIGRQARAIAKGEENSALGTRKALGTKLE